MGGSNKGWFWIPENLKKLKAILDDIAERDAQGFYFGPIGLVDQVRRHAKQAGLGDISTSQISHGIGILTFLGAFEPGKPGTKRKGYKRRYYPEKIARITQADVKRYRQQQKA